MSFLKSFKQNRLSELQHNKQVDADLAAVKKLVSDANTDIEILETLAKQGDKYQLQYQNKSFYYILILSIIPIVAIGFLPVYLYQTQHEPLFLLLLLLPLILLALVFSFRQSDKPKQAMLELVETRYEELKYGFRNQLNLETVDTHALYEDFRYLFRLGNYSNEVVRTAAGRFPGKLNYPFMLFHYHYVNERTETHGSGKDETTQTVYDHYDKWGMFVGEVPMLGFALTRRKNKIYPHRWKTSSISFNRRHNITGANEHELARLFQPINVERFEKLLADFKDFDVQVSDRLPVFYIESPVDLFRRAGKNNKHVATAPQLAAGLESMYLPNFEWLANRVVPFINKVVV